MKKTILHSLIIASCFAAIASCSKEVKAPTAQTTNSAVTKTPQPTTTQNQNTNQNQNHDGGGCGNHSGSYSGNGGW